jgi:hypothetical protein
MRTIQLLIEVDVNELQLGKEKVGDDIIRLIDGELNYVQHTKVILEQTVRCCTTTIKRPCLLKESSKP